jgi:two-component system chemotaxis response regulator CheB
VQKIEVIIMQRNLRRIHGRYQSVTPGRKKKEVSSRKLESRNIDLIAMGSSIGGIQSAMAIIPRLPAHMKPVVWVQHLPEGFSESLAKRFDVSSKMRVKLAEHNEAVEQGTCYIAPAGLQTRVEYSSGRPALKVQGRQRVSSHCPSCDVLFGSVSEFYAENAVGVILSGMGDDGAVGLKKMHQKGAFVIGEEEESCIVYGMPKMAMGRGAVDIELDNKDIAEAILEITGYKS